MRAFTAAALVALALAASAPAAVSGWRTAVVGQDRETGEYVFMYFTMQASVIDVRGLRLVNVGGSTAKAEASVECKKGTNEASRKGTFRIAKRGVVTLPLPIPGG